LAPEKMAGTPMELSEDELTYLDPLCRDLTYLGGMQSGAEMNKELIVDSGAQIIFSMGPGKINEAAISSADELQEQINIPVVVVSGIFEDMPKSYQLMGKIFGMEERATALADYCDKVLTDVMGAVATVPEEKRISVYYAEQADGLCTEPETSGHAAAFSYANALNVATVEGKGGSGLTPVSLEQVLAWDPQVIITWGDERGGAYSLIKSSPDWSKISAVQNGRIYAMPNVPFSWIDRPPSVNRFLGVQWIANLLYPDVYDVDIVAVAQEFYKLFYHIDLTPEQLHDLLANSIDKK
ncbi:MAG: ABC transporter substrate-binding protein, partial [Clostridiales bacterium]